jgi:hypothetical protein
VNCSNKLKNACLLNDGAPTSSLRSAISAAGGSEAAEDSKLLHPPVLLKRSQHAADICGTQVVLFFMSIHGHRSISAASWHAPVLYCVLVSMLLSPPHAAQHGSWRRTVQSVLIQLQSKPRASSTMPI